MHQFQIKTPACSVCSLALLLLVLLVTSGTAAASATPPGWPWHGVNMDSLRASPDDIRRYRRQLDVNAVRLALKIGKYAKRNGVSEEQAWSDSLAWLDAMLDACAREKIACVVNISNFLFSPDIDYKMRSPRVWNSPEMLEHIRQSVRRLVTHLKPRGGELVAYDFISEPIVKENGKARRPEAWFGLLEDISGILKRVDPQRWLIVSPGPWGGPMGYKSFTPISYERTIYGVHTYIPHQFTHQGVRKYPIGPEYPGKIGRKHWDKEQLRKSLKPLRNFQKRHNVPVLVGEFSAARWAKGGEQNIKDLVSLFDEYGWGWLYFSATGWHGWNPDYNQQYPGQGKGTSWKTQYVGESSERWKTLRKIFGIEQKSSR
jgi:hypothetical protein